MERKPELLIGSPDSEYLRVSPISRSGTDPSEFWDSNWLVAKVELSSGAFSGAFQANFRTHEFTDFLKQLEPLYERLSGEAHFSSMESWLSICISADGRGHFVAECDARDDPSSGNRLRICLHFDQTELPDILRGLRAIRARFPVLGAPAA